MTGVTYQRLLQSETDTQTLATALAEVCRHGAVIYLQGELGAGKTSFSRCLLQALGHAGNVKSPTYTLVEPYQLAELTVFHFDLYRVRDPEELEYMGIRDYFSPANLCLVEWPQRGEPLLPTPDWQIELQILGETSRQLTLTALSERGVAMLNQCFGAG
jgi:tRNA threonylcarbamoyladenosine biosynthesis protein TsaE